MSLPDEILATLRVRPRGMTDAELARMFTTSHQHVNQTCRRLAAEGRIVREDGGGVIVNRVGGTVPAPRPPSPPPVALAPTATRSTPAVPDRDWSWEGNVQAALCRWLLGEGWSLVQVANTATKERGTDVVVERGLTRLHIEVKGFPSKTYADPRRAGEIRKYPPAMQVTHWYADALLKVLRLREKHPADEVAMAFPEAARYRRLLDETATTLRLMRIMAFLVAEDGSVVRW
ncbi:MAG TPA: hypothetical protein VF054_06840 [Micromonosporaceae bacterium]